MAMLSMAVEGRALVTPDGRLRFQGQIWPCALGRAGIRVLKEEGDGATPAALLPLRRALYRADRGPRPASALPTEPIAPEDGWCDDPLHRDYNTAVQLPHPGRHERLWREDGLYEVLVVLGWNDRPVVRHRGSAIFLHVAPPGGAPTEGCIGLSERALREVLALGLIEIDVAG